MRLCTPSPETGEPLAAMALADAAPLYGGVGGDGDEEGGGEGGNEGVNGGKGSNKSSRAALTLLCEFVLNSSPTPPRDPSLYHTLLQLYLSEDGDGREEGEEASGRPSSAASFSPRQTKREADALALLQRGWPRNEADDPRFDPDTVLLLCRRAASSSSRSRSSTPSSSTSSSLAADQSKGKGGGQGWLEGQLFVHERRGAFREAMGVLAAAGDHRGVVETALRHGGVEGRGGRIGGGGNGGGSGAAAASSSSSSHSSADPGLIPLALEYVAGLDDDAARPCAVELLSALMGGAATSSNAGGGEGRKKGRAVTPTGGGGGGETDQASAHAAPSSFLVPPIVAIDVLSRNPRITLGDVKPFVAAALAADGQRAAADASEAARLRASAATARADALKLATEPCVFQATRCAASGLPLELPTVHFLCGHSFNAGTLRQRSAAAASNPAAAAGASAGLVPGQKKQRGASSSCTECPLCGPGLRTLAAASASASASASAAEWGGGAARRQQQQQQGTNDAAAADKFFSALRAAPDGFDAVADWVGRGLFAATTG